MDLTKLSAADIDYAEGKRRFAGNAAIYEKYLTRFEQDPSISELKEAMTAGDAERAFRSAHSLKGIAGNLSIHGLSQALSPFVEALRAGDLLAARPLYAAVLTAYDRAVEAIR